MRARPRSHRGDRMAPDPSSSRPTAGVWTRGGREATRRVGGWGSSAWRNGWRSWAGRCGSPRSLGGAQPSRWNSRWESSPRQGGCEMALRVLIVDDHTLVRAGIRALLQAAPTVEVVGEAEDGLSALDQVRALRPDVVLMDVAMPRLGGVDATRRIKEEFPQVQVLALTVHDNEEYLFQMLRAGACGYVLKKAKPVELVDAIEAAARGETFLYPSMATALVADYLRRVETGEEAGAYEELTPREREILKLIAEGYTSAEIGDLLHLSVKTVQAHRQHIMEKLDLHRPAQLIKYAIRKGLVEADS